MCGRNVIPLDCIMDYFIVQVILLLLWHYNVRDSTEESFLKSYWQLIPYIVGSRVMLRAMEVDYALNDFRLLRELKMLGFLYFLGYCFQSYL